MDFEFVPSVCNVSDSGWSGSITIQMPKYVERKRLLKKVGVNVSQSGVVENADGDPVETICKIVEEVEKHVQVVSLSLGTKRFMSFEDLQTDPRADEILEELAGVFIGGQRLGK